MAKFRKKSIVIDAEQWFPGKEVEGVHTFIGREDILSDELVTLGRVYSLEGILLVKPGDWIITGIAGEKYPVKPDIFEATYEAV